MDTKPRTRSAILAIGAIMQRECLNVSDAFERWQLLNVLASEEMIEAVATEIGLNKWTDAITPTLISRK